jgi:hypothetical protein
MLSLLFRNPVFGSMLAALAAVFSISLAACGGGDETTSSSTTTRTTTDGDNPAPRQPPLMGLPPAEENVKEASKRFQEAVESDDCEQINELNVLSRPGLATEQRCALLKRFVGLDVADTAEYGKLGGVIAYQRARRIFNAVLLRDSDGLFHIAYFDLLTGPAGTKGDLAQQFEQVAKKGTKALGDRNCKEFLKVANRRIGIARGDDKATCAQVKRNIVARFLARGGKAKPEHLDGSSSYAFFGVDTPGSYLTLIAARLTGPSEGLPKDAPEYGIVDAFETNPRVPPADSSGD